MLLQAPKVIMEILGFELQTSIVEEREHLYESLQEIYDNKFNKERKTKHAISCSIKRSYCWNDHGLGDGFWGGIWYSNTIRMCFCETWTMSLSSWVTDHTKRDSSIQEKAVVEILKAIKSNNSNLKIKMLDNPKLWPWICHIVYKQDMQTEECQG